ncbi:glycosyltransferase family 4 protein [Phenylobacterium sp.]|uniref:glycosyltransferase family 4 protein n=1 Tax=Phenylobacterium sp. TaxID=1871053 RepID=UPI0035C83846
MKIVLASSFVPFVHGGARFIVEWLEEKLREHGHEVERFYLPVVDGPEDILSQAALFRMMDLSEAGDRLIAFRPPAYVLPHPNKVLWFIHHIRMYYDLWGQPHSPEPTLANEAVRQALKQLDTRTLAEAQKIYTNSQVVSRRLQDFNGLASEPLYPPLHQPERFFNAGYGSDIVVVSRVEPHKRQALLIEAMAHVRSPVRLRLCGRASAPAYAEQLKRKIDALGVQSRVVFEDRWITEDEKAKIIADALAVAYLPQDEDSYGYPSLEAAHADKAVITTRDAGGVLELVEDGRNGFVAAPDPLALAEAFDQLYRDRALAERMGRENQARVRELKIDWNHVVQALTT